MASGPPVNFWIGAALNGDDDTRPRGRQRLERAYAKSEVIGLPSLPPILKGRLVGDITT